MNDITNTIEYKGTPKKSLLYKTSREDDLSTKNTLRSLKNAINEAKSIDYPNRFRLLSIYNDIIQDAHLAAVTKHRKDRITGLKYSLNKPTGKIDTNATELFNKPWFSRFLDYAIDAIFYGNSLVELFPDKTNDIVVNLIPRANVIPEFKQVKTNEYNINGDIDYSAPIYSNSLIDINNNFSSRDLGEYLSIAKLVMFKQEVLLNWSQYIEIFGQPIRIATSDVDNPAELQRLFKSLKDMGRSGSMVKNSQTTIDFVENSGSGKSELYKDFITETNNEISKKILGGTMLTDNGSSKSQSEVHERGSLLFTKSDLVFIETIINTQLVNWCISKGLLKSPVVFSFSEPEILTMEEKIKVDEFLLNNFDVEDIEYFNKRYGTKLKFKEKPNIKEIKDIVDNSKD